MLPVLHFWMNEVFINITLKYFEELTIYKLFKYSYGWDFKNLQLVSSKILCKQYLDSRFANEISIKSSQMLVSLMSTGDVKNLNEMKKIWENNKIRSGKGVSFTSDATVSEQNKFISRYPDAYF